MADSIVPQFLSGTHNVLDDENIPLDASRNSLGWLTIDGVIQLSNGREINGNQGLVGSIQNEWFGYKVDGTKVHYRKAGTVIQVLVGAVWTNVITGLTASARYTFSNYSSLAGAFVYINGIDGYFKINTANPTTFLTLTAPLKNRNAKAIIDKARMFSWAVPKDPTGLYGSHIDAQNGTVYTTVTGEVRADTSTGTLAFVSPTRNAFGIVITNTATGEVFTDDSLGNLTGSLGGTGAINYITGVYTTSSPASAGTADYQWEDSTVKQLADVTYSATRAAGEGFVIRQDEGGDAILQVLVGPDGNYYSMKSQSVYQLSIDPTDLIFTNQVYRKDIGIPSGTAAVSTGQGIIFMNTANPTHPELSILEKNPLSAELLPRILFPQYKFQNFVYDQDTIVDTFSRFIIVCCKTTAGGVNDVMLLCNLSTNTVDQVPYPANALAKDGLYLYAGSPYEFTTYKMFTDFDDDSSVIQNYWESKGEMYQTEQLKKFLKIRLRGLIDIGQSYEVYASYDDDAFRLVGTIRGTGSYVDYSSPQTVGSALVGTAVVGGTPTTTVYPYYTELKIKPIKFRKRVLKFVALGIGYVNINQIMDWDILLSESRIPARNRQKQNLNLAGTTSDNPLPQF